MGVGNLTELTDADTTGITMTLMGMVSELAIRNILVVQVSPHCRRAVAEAELARRIMYAARADGSLPQGYDPGMLALRDRRPLLNSPAEIAAMAAEVGDANWRIEVAEDGIHVYNRDGHHVAGEPVRPFPRLGVERRRPARLLSRRRAGPCPGGAPAGQALRPGQRVALGRGGAAALGGSPAFRPARQHPGGAPQVPAQGGELMPFIRESIVTTLNADGGAHIAPLGVIVEEPFLVIAPFRPSTTLDNLRRHGFACVNYTTDVRVFAGCVTRRRRDWPVTAAERGTGWRLAEALAHTEVEVAHVVEDELRPRFRCRTVHEAQHAPFLGFNRAQAAVLEGAILVSRLHLLSVGKIESEVRYLKIAIAKTAGDREREAWEWLMAAVTAAGIAPPESD